MIKRQLLAMNYKYGKLSKQLATGNYSNRDKQFQIIFTLVAIMGLNTPILSIDCKKKERIGNLYREGKCYSQAPIKVYDHDYEYLATGKIIPHGIYDLQHNKGYITLGNSHETAEFIADNLIGGGINMAYTAIQTRKISSFFATLGGLIIIGIIVSKSIC
jgi:hypothetical protein